MKTITVLLALLVAASGCNFSKSVKVDLISGLTTNGDIISCEDVYITVNDQKVERNTFIYGEEFFLNFNDIKGFKRIDAKVFPGMDIFVVGESGDTVFSATDLHKGNPEGFSQDPILLTSKLVAARPMRSGKSYKMLVKIWDEKDKGTFNAAFDFKVTASQTIKVESSVVTYDEIYMFSKERKKVIKDNIITPNDENYLIFEGLKGFSEIEGKVYPGLSMKITDDAGAEVLNYEDMFAENTVAGFEFSDFNLQVTPSFVIPAGEVKNPLHLKVLIWDKKSTAKISVSADLTFQK